MIATALSRSTVQRYSACKRRDGARRPASLHAVFDLGVTNRLFYIPLEWPALPGTIARDQQAGDDGHEPVARKLCESS
ncbi:hypothetical protein [Paraburkholderia sp. 40]|uniref:hypothetical protein n=1 Tax=Paraburkholderia sp. 40 TaxID=2991059 RepID=UPI003D1A9504